jgi:hypothetical protein
MSWVCAAPACVCDDSLPDVPLGVECVCDDSLPDVPLGVEWVWVSVPSVAPRVRGVNPDPVPEPIGARPRRSGMLNVLIPSPLPNVVPTAVKRAA